MRRNSPFNFIDPFSRGKISLSGKDLFNLQSPTCFNLDSSLWDLLDVSQLKEPLTPSNLLPTSNMLLETNESLTMPEDLNHLPLAQFPVAEHSSLNNTDLASFLDDIFLPENNLPTAVENMTDLNSFQGNFFPERSNISDWLSGNIEFDTIISQPNFQQSAEISNFLESSYSDASHAICSETVQNQNVGKVSSPLAENESLVYDLDILVNQESMHLSNHESSVTQTDLHQGTSPMTSESEEVIIEQVKEDDYSLAGKKYLQMRQKNNVASQRSRKLRKQKNIEMTERLKKLEVENLELTRLVTDMEKERDALQRLLLSVISKK